MTKIKYVTGYTNKEFIEELEQFINNNVECEVYYISYNQAFVHYKESNSGKSRRKTTGSRVSKKTNRRDTRVGESE